MKPVLFSGSISEMRKLRTQTAAAHPLMKFMYCKTHPFKVNNSRFVRFLNIFTVVQPAAFSSHTLPVTTWAFLHLSPLGCF